MLALGSVELISLNITAAAAANSAGNASGTIDPYIRIDPGFLGASGYRIEVSNGVGNSPADGIPIGVPEPAAWALLLTGFGVLGGTLRQRRAGWRLVRI